MFTAQKLSYDHSDAYLASVSGRMELAEHIYCFPLSTIY